MRRVAVTGLGVVSPIGDNAAQVAASLRAAKSGIVAAPQYAELGFRCQVHGLPPIDWEPLVDRKAQRFLSSGLAYGHVAMQQAIADAGLAEDEVSHELTGLIVGAGGPSTRAIVEAADYGASKGVKRIGPFAVPKAMSSGPSAALSTWFKIRGINYSITSACATSTHCIGAAAGADRPRPPERDVRRRLRGGGLDAVSPLRRHGRDVVALQRLSGDSEPAL